MEETSGMGNNTIVTTGLVLMGAFTGVLIALAVIGKDIRAREKSTCFPITLVGQKYIDCLELDRPIKLPPFIGFKVKNHEH